MAEPVTRFKDLNEKIQRSEDRLVEIKGVMDGMNEKIGSLDEINEAMNGMKQMMKRILVRQAAIDKDPSMDKAKGVMEEPTHSHQNSPINLSRPRNRNDPHNNANFRNVTILPNPQVHPHQQQNNNTNNPQFTSRLDFPEVDGTNPRAWIR